MEAFIGTPKLFKCHQDPISRGFWYERHETQYYKIRLLVFPGFLRKFYWSRRRSLAVTAFKTPL